MIDMHDRRAGRRLVVARPLNRAEFVEPGVGDASESRRRLRDLVHDLGRMRIVHLEAERLGESDRGLPIRHAAEWRHYFADAAYSAFGIGESAVLFEERRARQEDMRITRGLIEENVLNDDAFHRPEAGRDVLRIRVGLRDILALYVKALEGALDRLVHHVRDTQARLVGERNAPETFENLARRVVRDVAVAGEFVRERAHVAGALDIVLPAQRIHADADA